MNSAGVLAQLETGLQATRTHITETEAAIEEAKEYLEEMQRKRAEARILSKYMYSFLL